MGYAIFFGAIHNRNRYSAAGGNHWTHISDESQAILNRGYVGEVNTASHNLIAVHARSGSMMTITRFEVDILAHSLLRNTGVQWSSL